MNHNEALTQYLDLADENEALLNNGLRPTLWHIHNFGEAALGKILDGGWHPAQTTPPGCYPENIFGQEYGVNLARVPMPADIAASFRCGVPKLSSLLAIVANDAFTPSDALLQNCPDGLTVKSLRSLEGALWRDAEAMMTDRADEPSPGVAIDSLLLQDGVYIRSDAGAEIDKAVQIVNLFNSPVALLTPRRVVIHAMPGSKLKVLLCDHSQTPAVPHCNIEVIDLWVEEGASVELYDIEESSAMTRRSWHLNAIQCACSSLSVDTFFLSGGMSHNNIAVSLTGPGARTLLGGLAICTGSQQADTQVLLRHKAPHCESRQLFKTALFDSSRGGFGGCIVVDNGGVGTDAAQTNRNMLVDPGTHMETAPQLEIYCDEVKCSHGATAGQLDERALFYMQSRGIPADEARQMLTQAFMADVIDNISFEVLRQRMHVLVEKRLSGASASCDTCATACHGDTPHNETLPE